ncbi:MAG: hypothetical protein ACLFUU_11410 [Desulfobacteraceae bacterium]
MRKRNKRSSHTVSRQISPLTNCILAQMGEEGKVLRQRLEQFFQARGAVEHPDWEDQQIEKSRDF